MSFKDAEKVLETSANSAGSALKENAKYLESIAGKLDQLRATWQEASAAMLDSHVITAAVSALTEIIDLINNLDKLLGGFGADLLMVAASVGAARLAFKAYSKDGVELLTILSDLIPLFGQIKQWRNSFGTAASVGSVLTPTRLGLVGMAASLAMVVALLPKIAREIRSANFEKLTGEIDGINGELETLQAELKTNKERIQELRDVATRGNLGIVEAGELENLEREDELLERQIELQERKLELAEQEAAEAARVQIDEFYTYSYSERSYSGTAEEHLLRSLSMYSQYEQDLQGLLAKPKEQLSQYELELITDLREAKARELGIINELYSEVSAAQQSLDMDNPDDIALNQQLESLYAEILFVTQGANKLWDHLWKADASFPGIEEYRKQLSATAGDQEAFNRVWVDFWNDKSMVSWRGALFGAGFKLSEIPFEQIINYFWDIEDAAKATNVAIMSEAEIIEQYEDEIDALGAALVDMKKQNYLGVDAIKALTAEGVDLGEYLEETANGYELSTGALEDYIDAQLLLKKTAVEDAKAAATNVIKAQFSQTAAIEETAHATRQLIEAQLLAQKVAQEGAAKLSYKANMERYIEEGNPEYFEELQSSGDLDSTLDNLWLDSRERKALLDLSNDPIYQQIEPYLQAWENAQNNEDRLSKFLDLMAGKVKDEVENTERDYDKIYKALLDKQENIEHLVERLKNAPGDTIDRQATAWGELRAAIVAEMNKLSDIDSDDYRYLEKMLWEVDGKLQSLYDDMISEYEHANDRLSRMDEDTTNARLDMWRTARARIVAEMDKITDHEADAYKELEKLLWGIEDEIENIYNEQKDALETIIELTQDMIRQEMEDQIDAIEEQTDAYQELIDAKKKALALAKSEADYEDQVAEKVKEISKIQSQIALLELDDSREAHAQKVALEEELAELNKELADIQADYTMETTEEALDDAADSYEKHQQDRIDTLQDVLDDEQALYKAAIDRIDNDWEGLYADLSIWIKDHRSAIDGPDSLLTAWQTVQAVMERCAGMSIGDVYENFANGNGLPSSSTTGGNNALRPGNAGGDGLSSYINDAVISIVERMHRNSVEYVLPGVTTEARAQITKSQNELVAAFETQTGQDLVKGSDSVWRIKGIEGETLYSYFGLEDIDKVAIRAGDVPSSKIDPNFLKLKKYHTGGIAGGFGTLKDKELLAILEDNELILNGGHKANLAKALDAIKATMDIMISGNVFSGMQAMKAASPSYGGDTYAPVINVSINHNGTMTDADAKKYGKQISQTALDTLYDTMRKRGIKK